MASELDIAVAESYRIREPGSGRSYAVLKLATRSGLAGYGECKAIGAEGLARIREAVLAKPATSYEVIRRQLQPPLSAAVDMALLDIFGKSVKAPAYQIMGGPTRFKARALARLAASNDDALPGEFDRARAAGFRAVSAPAPLPAAANQGRAYVERVQRRMEGLRKAGNGAVELVLDGGGALSPGDAANLASALETFHLLWFDEPCGAVQIGAMRTLAAECVTPIGCGRSVSDLAVFQDLLREDAVDVLRPDIDVYGPTQVRRVAALAETYYIAIAPFHDGGPIGTAAALHAAAAIPNFYAQQIPLASTDEDRKLRAALGSAVETVKDGFAALPTGPGLGIQVDESVLAQYKERT